jgi:hypothetical protein
MKPMKITRTQSVQFNFEVPQEIEECPGELANGRAMGLLLQKFRGHMMEVSGKTIPIPTVESLNARRRS